MAYKNINTNMTEMLLECMTKPNPMLNWLCDKMIEVNISPKIDMDKSQNLTDRQSYLSSYLPRRIDTRMGMVYMIVPKMHKTGYAPLFVSDRSRTHARGI